MLPVETTNLYPFYRYNDRPRINRNRRLDVTALIREMKLEMKEKYKLDPEFTDPRSGIGANMIKHYFEMPHLFDCLIELMVQHQPRIQVDYIKSNIRGFIFYFICNDCERRVRHLYQIRDKGRWACRRCHFLGYERRFKRKKDLNSYRPK